MNKIPAALLMCISLIIFVSCNRDYKYKEVVEATEQQFSNVFLGDTTKILSEGHHFDIFRVEDYRGNKVVHIEVIDSDRDYYIHEVCKVIREHGYPESLVGTGHISVQEE